jgi:hypothetical protein
MQQRVQLWIEESRLRLSTRGQVLIDEDDAAAQSGVAKLVPARLPHEP